jgi:RNA polymerase sigma factor (sigma-70 family)
MRVGRAIESEATDCRGRPQSSRLAVVLFPLPVMSPHARSSTQTLLRAVAAGDLGAREVLYARLRAPLARWARGRLPDDARDLLDTDDLVQTAFSSSLQHVEGFEEREGEGFLRYLRRSVSNRITDEVRRIRRRPRRTDLPEHVSDPAPSPIDRLLSQEEQECYDRALASLSPSDQDLVIARVEWHMPFRDIAIHTGRPSAAAARVAFNRALERLASKIASLQRHGRC